jgi:hypothetical protein
MSADIIRTLTVCGSCGSNVRCPECGAVSDTCDDTNYDGSCPALFTYSCQNQQCERYDKPLRDFMQKATP